MKKRSGDGIEELQLTNETLQKELEQKNRELEIEAALERLRARSSAMHKSNELKDVVRALYKEFRTLVTAIDSVNIQLNPDSSKDIHFWASVEEDIYPELYHVPYSELPIFEKFYNAFHSPRDEFFDYSLNKEEKDAFFREIFNVQPVPPKRKKLIQDAEGMVMMGWFHKHSGIDIVRYNLKRFSEEEKKIVQRFAATFEQTYTRFLDLQKAEAQAREAQIEAALERVRARSMAMHHSRELVEVVRLLDKEIKGLGIQFVDATQILTDFSNPKEGLNSWITVEGMDYLKKFHVPYLDHPNWFMLSEALKKGQNFYTEKYLDTEKNRYFRLLFKYSDFGRIPKERQAVLLHAPGLVKSYVIHKNSILLFQHNGLNEFSAEDNAIFRRFGAVFEQAYTRFLDLQKAEAQARESEIQLALERVRARTMAMHKSDELAETAAILFQQMTELGVTPERINICLINEADKILEVWATDQQGMKISHHFNASLDEPTTGKRVYDAWKEKKKSIIIDLSGKELNDWIRYVREVMGMTIKAELVKEHRIHSVAFFSQGMILTTTPELLPEESIKLLERFADVFNLTYRRFLDLQKAEEQAREAQIEAALERVRSRTMGMQHSDELNDLIAIVFKELTQLDLILTRGIFMIWEPDHKSVRWWMANSETPSEPMNFLIPHHSHPAQNAYVEAWKDREPRWTYELQGKSKREWDDYLFSETELSTLPLPVIEGMKAPDKVILTASFSAFGCLAVASLEPLSESHIELIMRFTKVFDQTFTRFLDLQKAEAQARESEIQLALERVRARTMAMHNSDELGEVASVLFEQISSLTATPDRFNIGIANEEDKSFDIWVTDQEGHKITKRFIAESSNSPVIAEAFQLWKKQEKFKILDLYGEKLENWVRYMGGKVGVPFRKDRVKDHRFISSVIFSHGFIGVTTNKEPDPETIHLLERFSKVFQQTYVRFLDLQKAEAQAREAVKQASLDRIRGEIASMRTTEDLNRITPVIWNELKTLNVPFIRCGVFIINEFRATVQVYLSKPDGKPLAALSLPFESTRLTRESVATWRKGAIYKEHWNRDDFVRWMQSLIKMGQVQSAETYQGADQAPESLDLHFLPFTQGMLYVGNTSPLSEDEIELVQSLADTFSVAYARYEDFNNLEEAKNKIEQTLSELKATQSQLVQAEKMASLGELTAGIAHEIQNPLNFVNNFSEVSTELLEEMKEEIENGDLDEVKAITEDVIQNLEKILHHGRRADGIVKGMLQHSRGSSGQKEPTDINTLCDEYLRLSYHGLRARDKSFTADFKLEADESLPKVNVVPQDMGRVLLNLINNAFYVVSEKAKQNLDGYKPSVIVSTRSGKSPSGDLGVEIRVKDNGPGIPDDVKKKIFQPFFTTKPTGQGTGLGLSMSFDVVKAHGGKLTMESKDGQGTEFTIQLPNV